MAELSVREAGREREKARAFWKSLSSYEKGMLGDELVFGAVDYLTWFDGAKPSRVFLDEVDYLRILWEQGAEGDHV